MQDGLCALTHNLYTSPAGYTGTATLILPAHVVNVAAFTRKLACVNLVNIRRLEGRSAGCKRTLKG